MYGSDGKSTVVIKRAFGEAPAGEFLTPGGASVIGEAAAEPVPQGETRTMLERPFSRPVLIVGPRGAGKSTFAGMLATALNARNPFREIGVGETSDVIVDALAEYLAGRDDVDVELLAAAKQSRSEWRAQILAEKEIWRPDLIAAAAWGCAIAGGIWIERAMKKHQALIVVGARRQVELTAFWDLPARGMVVELRSSRAKFDPAYELAGLGSRGRSRCGVVINNGFEAELREQAEALAKTLIVESNATPAQGGIQS